jgi:hypothetical protein
MIYSLKQLTMFNLIIHYLKINARYQASLASDPDLMLTVSVANILIFNDDSLTPWTDVSLVDVDDYSFPYYLNNPIFGYAISANKSINLFANVINNMKLNFTFDYAVAIMKYEHLLLKIVF